MFPPEHSQGVQARVKITRLNKTKMKKLNAYEKIQLGMKQNEAGVIEHLKMFKRLEYDRCSASWMKAVDRLTAKGKIQYSDKKSGYVLAK